MYPSKAMMITVHSQRPKLTSAFGKSSDLWEQQNNLECAHSNGSVTTNNEFPFHNSTLARYKCSLLYALPSITVTGQKAAVLIKIWTLGTLDLLHIFMVQLAIMSYLDPQNRYKLRLDPSSISSGCCRCPNTYDIQRSNIQTAGPVHLLRNRSSSVPAIHHHRCWRARSPWAAMRNSNVVAVTKKGYE